MCSASLAGPWLSALCLAAFGCGERIPEPDLAPRLLDDRAELAAYVEAFPSDEFEVASVPNVGRFYVDDDSMVKERLRSGQPWSPHLIAEFERYVVLGSTVLDVGAHIGSLSVPLGRLVGSEGRVYAFEPQRSVYRELVQNLRLNGLDQVVALRFAVSSQPGIIEMTPHFVDDGWGRIGAGGDPAEARTLDSFGFSDVSLVKIDVEGHEIEVLKGAEQTIRSSLPVLVIEIPPSNLDTVGRLLKDWGYRLRRVQRDALDFVALPPARPSDPG